jgi:hypothetical protein
MYNNYNPDCKYSIKKKKKFSSFQDLLEERKTCERLEKITNMTKYYNTEERLACLKAKVKYNSLLLEK